MIKILKNNIPLIIIEIIVITAFCTFYGRYGDVMVDSFREVYIPQQMLSGESLYKNIFCIYPPFSYIINAFLFKVFGISLKVAYFAGLFTTLGIFYFAYKILKKFFNEFLTISLCVIVISAFVLSPNVFNPFFPYSYGLLYGVLFSLASVYFALERKFSVSYLLFSCATCSKLEFLLLLPALLYFSRRENLKLNLLITLVPPTINLAILFLTGTDIQSLFIAFNLMNIMKNSQSLYLFYSIMGLVFRWEVLPIYFENLIKFFVPFFTKYYQAIFVGILPLITILAIFRYKKFSREEKFVVFATLLISLKVFFALTLQAYGVFFLVFAIIALMVVTPEKFRKILAVYLIIWSLIIGYNNIQIMQNKNVPITSSKGTIKTQRYYAENINDILKDMARIPNGSKILVLPECLAINFFSEKSSISKIYSLIPLYIETFGEDSIIKHIEKYPPEYVITSDYDTSAYYYKKFGNDYGINVMTEIKKNYELEKKYDKYSEFCLYRKATLTN